MEKIQKFINEEFPVMILIGGTLGSGKSYIVETYFPDVITLDPDKVVEELSGGKGKWDIKLGGKARAIVQQAFKKLINEKKTFIKQGVAANLNAVLAQNDIAKKAGFKTIFLYVDTSLKTAKTRANLRFMNGERLNEIPHYKIEKKLKESKEVYFELSKMNEFDIVFKFDNDI